MSADRARRLTRLSKVLSIIAAAVFMVGCAATRYESFKPAGTTETWTVKGDLSITGWVTITINNEEAIRGQFPVFQSQEFQGEFRGHQLKMALTNELGKTEEGMGKRCILMIDGAVAARFNW